jgi:hypothetical protein
MGKDAKDSKESTNAKESQRKSPTDERTLNDAVLPDNPLT